MAHWKRIIFKLRWRGQKYYNRGLFLQAKDLWTLALAIESNCKRDFFPIW